MNVTPEFEKWAKGFSGCDGGNLQGSIWLCGVEWGMGAEHVLEEEIRKPVTKPPQIYKSGEENLKYPLNRMFLKLIAALRGRPVEDYEDVAREEPFPFHRHSDFFKLNLFPIAFKDVKKKKYPQLWNECRRATGLSTADDYLDWCRENRFPQMRSWVKRGQPNLIIGVGLEYQLDFQKAFGFEGVVNEERIEGTRLVWMSNGKSILALVPSPTSPSGLNSNKRMQAFGKRLRAILNGRG